MNDINKVYKVLLSVFILAVALQLFFVWMVFLPKQEELDVVKEDVDLILAKLRKKHPVRVFKKRNDWNQATSLKCTSCICSFH